MTVPRAMGADVVVSRAEAARCRQEPLLVLEPLVGFLEAAGLGAAAITAAVPIGAGHSNVTFALQRESGILVLRRPPRGPLPPSAHDVIREARLLLALSSAGVRVPEVLALCDDTDVIGAPFYIMAFIDGHVLGELPREFSVGGAGEAIADQLVGALTELHAVDITVPELAAIGRPAGYLERQLRRFSDLLAHNATRSLPQLEDVHAWLTANIPAVTGAAVVHGDYRLGNVMFGRRSPPRIVAVLDWEMATLGDPLCDIGYLTATWADPEDPGDPILDLSPATRLPGFPGRTEIARRYGERTGRDLADLRWYQTLALWKSSIFLEGSYRRYRAGTTADPYFATLEHGVPTLARRALALTEMD